MKTSILLACLVIVPVVHATDMVEFVTAKARGIQGPRSVKVSSEDRLVIKIPEGGILILELLEAGNEGIAPQSREWASFDWQVIKDTAVARGRKEASITYSVKVDDKGDHHLTQVDGSETFVVAKQKMRWSVSEQDVVYVYPEAGWVYALTTRPNKSE